MNYFRRQSSGHVISGHVMQMRDIMSTSSSIEYIFNIIIHDLEPALVADGVRVPAHPPLMNFHHHYLPKLTSHLNLPTNESHEL